MNHFQSKMGDMSPEYGHRAAPAAPDRRTARRQRPLNEEGQPPPGPAGTSPLVTITQDSFRFCTIRGNDLQPSAKAPAGISVTF